MKKMTAERLVYIDDHYVKKNEAKISVFDHGLLYGDGVFEGIRSYDGFVFKLDEHIDRLYSSAKYISLDIPLRKNEMKEKILETLRKNQLKDAYIRVVVTRGKGDLGLDPRKCPKPSIFIITDKITLYEKTAIKAVTSSTVRNAGTALSPMVKSLNYLNNILARIDANRADVDEAIMLNQRGFVSEGTGDNLFIIKDSIIITPPPTADILLGITRNTVIDLAKNKGIKVIERDITLYELYNADEAFLTGTAAEVAPLIEVDSKKIGDGKSGPITQKIIQIFNQTKKSGTPIYN
jgi:branched-chain amino acid aminotransferase